MKTIVRTTCPRDCYDACGIAVVKRDGVVTKVLGDPDHPVARGALCGKCALAYNGAWRDPTARLLRPLIRVGAKGGGQFRTASWDEVLGVVADRLGSIIDEHGCETIWHTHYTGTCSKLAGGFPSRFFNAIGASEVDPDSICNAAGHVALNYVLGSSYTGFDPRTAKDAACIVVWGANPSASAPHAHKQWLKETPAKVVVVDPIRHPTAAAAHLHLQPFPGTDAALAFALLHVMRRDGRLDRGFIEAHTFGWDEVEPLLDACTPAWAAGVTGVTAAQIEEAARLYTSGPAMLWLGQGLQRQPLGGNVMRACALLPAATGNFARPGAGLYYLNGGGRKGLTGGFVDRPDLRTRPERLLSHMDLAVTLADPHKARALVSWNINIAASNPQQERLRGALARDDLFTVVVDLFQTDTADLADVVLPAASFLEFDDLVSPYFNLTLSAQVKAMEPLGEALPNQEIFRRLARRMGLPQPALYEEDGPLLDAMCRQAGVAGGFSALAAAHTIEVFADPVLQFADLHFPTPSGRIEIASERAEAAGLPRTPLPLVDPRPVAGRLRLLSPASPWLMNSSYGNDLAVADRLGESEVCLHPTDAAARGLGDGAAVRLVNETGSLPARLHLDATLPPGVALAAKGRWPKGSGGANINRLNPGQKADMGESTAVHGVEVAVEAALETPNKILSRGERAG